MAKITDPDFLNQGTEVNLNPTAGYIALAQAGNLTEDGVTLQALYSFLKEEWRTDASLIKYPFPLEAITPEQFELKNGWNFSGTLTKNLIRDGGWAVKDASSLSSEEYMNLTTLGSFYETGDKAYYRQTTGSLPVDAVYAGPMNQAIKIYQSGATGFDYRSYFKIFLREQGKTYDSYDLITQQNISALTYKKFALPLSNASDLKISATDAFIATGAIYSGVGITYYPTGIPRTMGSNVYKFHTFISGAGVDKVNIYEKVQYQLRQNSDIDQGAGLVTGKVTDELLEFIGDTLRSASGVFIDDIESNDINSVEFTDISGVVRTYPFTSAGTISFNENLINDTSSKYWMYFTTNPGGNFGTANAIIVQDGSSNPITGNVNGQSSVNFTFNYDSNSQGGRTPATDAAITLVGIGLSGAQYVTTTATIGRSISNNISLISVLERNFSN